MVDKPVKIRTQRIYATGRSSLVVVVPRVVVDELGLKPGDEVDVLWDGAGTLTYVIKKKGRK